METCLDLLLTHTRTHTALGLLLKNKASWNNWSNCLVFKISIGQIQLASHLLSEDVFWLCSCFSPTVFLKQNLKYFQSSCPTQGHWEGQVWHPGKASTNFLRGHIERQTTNHAHTYNQSKFSAQLACMSWLRGSQNTWRNSTSEDPGVEPTTWGSSGNHCTALNKTNEWTKWQQKCS